MGKNSSSLKSQFGIFGLGVMGKSLSRNFASKGVRLSMYNRHLAEVEENVASDFKSEFLVLADSQAFDNLAEFVDSLEQPRKILLMVKAGKTIDTILELLLPHLSKGDIIIDGGNSHYSDTERRIKKLQESQIHFLGCGISGGESGALNGPSLMPGGNSSAYKAVKDYLELIAAKDKRDKPCCTYIGSAGSGNFVKTIHNGIEYVEMQLLAEVYFIYKKAGKTPIETAEILDSWKTYVDSFLLEITVTILRTLENGESLLEKVLDKAGNKGTGNWSAISSTELGIPSTLISSSLYARYISTFKEMRTRLSNIYKKEKRAFPIDDTCLLEAYKLARIINHYQGFALLNEASEAMNYNLSLSELARIWTNGCIIRSELMESLVPILKINSNILESKEIISKIQKLKPSLSKTVSQSICSEIPIPCFSEAINFFNGITEQQLPANLIQAQRDCFGAHTYRRNDKNDGKSYHTKWGTKN